MNYAKYNPIEVNLATVVVKALILGAIFLANAILALFNHLDIISTPLQLHYYLMFWCIFHTLEFVTTCLFNNSQVDDDSFILEDWDIHSMNILCISEFAIRWYWWSQNPWKITWYAVGLVALGQICRTLAMYTASESFNHYIQREHNEKTHQLVTTGIYSVLRHPSYFGFWWWFVGLQLFMNNTVTFAVGGYVLWNFFNKRIQFEEGFLVKFFKDAYIDYRKRTITGIPFIK
ncbi:ICMT-domain-containing protein [Suhomyces tanzawaensis NRRL Y-17324]|uniref:Protein-S-isoprenylcysteine O-methyltransferase n=1 Tax=Suhomyces tanzawaensis NRRL Y-17324 TaxID=984487 RepID=A0A1E4SHE7_9ASCO|nr:ICMT-domain-containing protein [Suhomyces tanzawaensis NRRL Y-17324]ODV78916.1 ICMT-domain-containing protein [Suhomyces tanzawaensis NRRL Y-17324]